MNNDQEQYRRLRILQINMNKSEAAHLDLINRNLADNWDIVCLQEPHITKYGNIRTPNKFRQVYPVDRHKEGAGRVRSAMWINEAIDTNNWEMVAIQGTNDITAVRLTGPYGKLAIFNVYNPCDNNTVQELLDRFLIRRRGEFYDSDHKHVIWCGDFNRHHPLWDRDEDVDLFRGQNRDRADKFISILAEHDMMMALPKGIPTICTHRTKRYTRPDNIFMTEQTLAHVARCDVESTWRPPNTDHFPIVTMLELPTKLTTPRPMRNFKQADWKEFREALERQLPELNIPGVIATVRDLEEQTQALTRIIRKKPPLPYSGR
ncbi:hypothetical protein NP233_g11792 [Leucocoprinus birnbaumii]|uniref:Endonuclease/exonuclease/phosphatase domain-containing protein n=1 Tax=Leucocoprinus birnbaumii TaxID=56174 RepID=A0AAD5VLJ3_9AGAR|nr:hypothetical protein NP233_g11792 [Leucocoprinus birnbaumii]